MNAEDLKEAHAVRRLCFVNVFLEDGSKSHGCTVSSNNLASGDKLSQLSETFGERSK